MLIAGVAAAVLAYGTRPSLARYEHGIQTIIFVRNIQWLLVSLTLIACLALLTMVVANRVSAWWLVGLAPVLALFAVRFAPGYARATTVLDSPMFVEAAHPAAPLPNEWVVGLVFEGEPYAFPSRALFDTPIVVVTDYSKRMLLMWSAHANRAVAVNITRDLRPRALEVVSTPADSLLIFDRRYGQFISSVTGKTIKGTEPHGFAAPIAVTKTTFAAWRAKHPDTSVMLPVGDASSRPSTPLAPRAALPPDTSAAAPARTQICMLGTQPPVAIRSDLPLDRPLNLVAGQTRLVLLRDRKTGMIRAFHRQVSHDRLPIFSLRSDTRRHSDAVLVDSDTHSFWTIDGRATDGSLKGERLREIPLDDGLWWGVMKFWYPQLTLLRPDVQ